VNDGQWPGLVQKGALTEPTRPDSVTGRAYEHALKSWSLM